MLRHNKTHSINVYFNSLNRKVDKQFMNLFFILLTLLKTLFFILIKAINFVYYKYNLFYLKNIY